MKTFIKVFIVSFYVFVAASFGVVASLKENDMTSVRI